MHGRRRRRRRQGPIGTGQHRALSAHSAAAGRAGRAGPGGRSAARRSAQAAHLRPGGRRGRQLLRLHAHVAHHARRVRQAGAAAAHRLVEAGVAVQAQAAAVERAAAQVVVRRGHAVARRAVWGAQRRVCGKGFGAASVCGQLQAGGCPGLQACGLPPAYCASAAPSRSTYVTLEVVRSRGSSERLEPGAALGSGGSPQPLIVLASGRQRRQRRSIKRRAALPKLLNSSQSLPAGSRRR